jgi:hypothetical protein
MAASGQGSTTLQCTLKFSCRNGCIPSGFRGVTYGERMGRMGNAHNSNKQFTKARALADVCISDAFRPRAGADRDKDERALDIQAATVSFDSEPQQPGTIVLNREPCRPYAEV